MDIEDVLRRVCSFLDDNTLLKLFQVGLLDKKTSFLPDQYFWHSRVETLLQKKLEWIAPSCNRIEGKKSCYEVGCWRGTYKILRPAPAGDSWSFIRAKYNPIAMRVLILSGLDPSCRDNDTVISACIGGLIDSVKILLSDPRVDPSAQHNSALRWAAGGGHLEVVRLLLLDPRVDPSDNMALKRAQKMGHEDVVSLLLEKRTGS